MPILITNGHHIILSLDKIDESPSVVQSLFKLEYINDYSCLITETYLNILNVHKQISPSSFYIKAVPSNVKIVFIE